VNCAGPDEHVRLIFLTHILPGARYYADGFLNLIPLPNICQKFKMKARLCEAQGKVLHLLIFCHNPFRLFCPRRDSFLFKWTELMGEMLFLRHSRWFHISFHTSPVTFCMWTGTQKNTWTWSPKQTSQLESTLRGKSKKPHTNVLIQLVRLGENRNKYKALLRSTPWC